MGRTWEIATDLPLAPMGRTWEIVILPGTQRLGWDQGHISAIGVDCFKLMATGVDRTGQAEGKFLPMIIGLVVVVSMLIASTKLTAYVAPMITTVHATMVAASQTLQK